MRDEKCRAPADYLRRSLIVLAVAIICALFVTRYDLTWDAAIAQPVPRSWFPRLGAAGWCLVGLSIGASAGERLLRRSVSRHAWSVALVFSVFVIVSVADFRLLRRIGRHYETAWDDQALEAESCISSAGVNILRDGEEFVGAPCSLAESWMFVQKNYERKTTFWISDHPDVVKTRIAIEAALSQCQMALATGKILRPHIDMSLCSRLEPIIADAHLQGLLAASESIDCPRECRREIADPDRCFRACMLRSEPLLPMEALDFEPTPFTLTTADLLGR